MQKKNLLLVLNPISGGKSKSSIPRLIEVNLDHNKFNYEIYWWEEVGALPQKITTFIADNGYAIIAVGGDGTVNSIATAILEKEILLGIVPMGSGNGLARELQVALKPNKAIQNLTKAKRRNIDVGMLNKQVFVNVAGCGFDATVAHRFSTISSRGFLSYVKAVLQEYKSAKNNTFVVQSEGLDKEVKGFMMSIANGTQWGNNFYVSPDASYHDGVLDLVFLKKPKWYQIPGLIWSLVFKKPHSLMEKMKISEAEIYTNTPEYMHLDGESWGKVNKLIVEIKHQALGMLLP